MAKSLGHEQVAMDATNTLMEEKSASSPQKEDVDMAADDIASNAASSQFINLVTKVNPQTLLLLLIGYVLIKPELSGMCF